MATTDDKLTALELESRVLPDHRHPLDATNDEIVRHAMRLGPSMTLAKPTRERRVELYASLLWPKGQAE